LNTVKFAVISALILCAIGIIADHVVHGDTGLYDPQIDEDKILICVSGQLADPEVNGNICHLYDPLDFDWYQEINNIGHDNKFTDLNDSFEVELKH
jgi:hypothetical protein